MRGAVANWATCRLVPVRTYRGMDSSLAPGLFCESPWGVGACGSIRRGSAWNDRSSGSKLRGDSAAEKEIATGPESRLVLPPARVRDLRQVAGVSRGARHHGRRNGGCRRTVRRDRRGATGPGRSADHRHARSGADRGIGEPPFTDGCRIAGRPPRPDEEPPRSEHACGKDPARWVPSRIASARTRRYVTATVDCVQSRTMSSI